MDEAGNTKDDLSLPKGTDDAEKLAQQIQEDFDAGKELVVTVLKVSSNGHDHSYSLEKSLHALVVHTTA